MATIAQQIHYFDAYPAGGLSLMARIQDWSAVDILQAGVTSIAWTSYDKADVSAVVASGTLTVADVIFDTLQTDARWDVDSTGYNFRWDAPATVAPASAKHYQILLTFTPASGAVFYAAYEANTLDIIGK